MWNNPYSQQPQFSNYWAQQQTQQNPVNITRVNGEGGAKAFQLPPNSSCLLLDDTAPIVWLKTTDGAGYPSLKPYTITEYTPAPAVDVNSLENRVRKLEELLSGIQSDTTGS